MFERINQGLWWDRALTLVEGCTPVSPGCDNCWSAAMVHRVCSPKNDDLSFNGDNFLTDKTGKWTGKIICRQDRLDLPLKVKKPTVWAVWNDLFHEDVPDIFIREFFRIASETERHIFLVLTKDQKK